MRLRLLVLLLGVATGCEAPSPLLRIAQLEDARESGGDELVGYLSSPSGGIRVRAARAAARLQSPALIPPLAALLSDDDPAVLAEAAFALGQIALAHPTHAPAVARALAPPLGRRATIAAPVAAELLAALGKCRVEASRPMLGAACGDPRAGVRGEAALALARLGGGTSEMALRNLLGDRSGEVRWSAAYALWQIGATDSASIAALSDRAIRDSVDVVRRMAARALGAEGSDAALRGLRGRLVRGERGTGSQVAVIRAVQATASREAVEAVGGFVHSPYSTVRAVALAAIAPHARDADVADLLLLSHDPHPAVRAEVPAALHANPDPACRARLLELASDPSPLVRAGVVRALVSSTTGSPALAALASDPSPRVRAAWLSTSPAPPGARARRALAAMEDPDPLVVVEALRILERAAGDARVTSGEAVPFRDELNLRYRAAVVPPVKRALARTLAALGPRSRCDVLPFLFDDDPVVRHIGWSAAMALPGDGSCRLPPRAFVERARERSARSAIALERLPERAEIVTTAGVLLVELHSDEAPRTVAHFARLAASGYYDGTRVYAAAPDSIVALGCVRGDGLGRADRRVRCEFGRRRFERGTLAFAHEGKDAAEGRFFVTPWPEPLLDGVYTPFGIVRYGMELVDRLVVGDRILRVVVS